MTFQAFMHRNSGPLAVQATKPVHLERQREGTVPGKDAAQNRAPAQRHERGATDAGTRPSRRRPKWQLMISALLVVAGGAGGTAWWVSDRSGAPAELILHGNVDLRQVALAFNNNERIAAVLVQADRRGSGGSQPETLDQVFGPVRAMRTDPGPMQHLAR